jgi:hypothetical protein
LTRTTPADFVKPLNHHLAAEVFGVHLKEGVQILQPAFGVVVIFEPGDMETPEKLDPMTQAVDMTASLEHLRIAMAREAPSA